uniref:hypothetical protein n=1 Tax=Rathayibacter sp. VKM Ac-2630 TaxID=1938617 RepID=UPI001F3F35CE|nr:hypothetical protein [Rathayibacter sp. VKM Ac-2630]
MKLSTYVTNSWTRCSSYSRATADSISAASPEPSAPTESSTGEAPSVTGSSATAAGAPASTAAAPISSAVTVRRRGRRAAARSRTSDRWFADAVIAHTPSSFASRV